MDCLAYSLKVGEVGNAVPWLHAKDVHPEAIQKLTPFKPLTLFRKAAPILIIRRVLAYCRTCSVQLQSYLDIRTARTLFLPYRVARSEFNIVITIKRLSTNIHAIRGSVGRTDKDISKNRDRITKVPLHSLSACNNAISILLPRSGERIYAKARCSDLNFEFFTTV